MRSFVPGFFFFLLFFFFFFDWGCECGKGRSGGRSIQRIWKWIWIFFFLDMDAEYELWIRVLYSLIVCRTNTVL